MSLSHGSFRHPCFSTLRVFKNSSTFERRNFTKNSFRVKISTDLRKINYIDQVMKRCHLMICQNILPKLVWRVIYYSIQRLSLSILDCYPGCKKMWLTHFSSAQKFYLILGLFSMGIPVRLIWPGH